MWSRCSFSITSKHSIWPLRRARRHDRNLALERHEGFEDLRLAAELVEQRDRIAAVADHHLALAVVAEAARLQHRGLADRGQRGGQPLGRIDRGEIAPCRCRATVTNSFSISRSCVVASTFGSGSTGLRAERNVAVSAGTFSNS